MMVDSGAACHAIPPWMAPQYPTRTSGLEYPLKTASGHRLTHYGARTVHLKIENLVKVSIQFESLNVLKNLGALCHANLHTRRGLPSKYLTTRLMATQSPFLGLAILLEHSLLAYRMSGRSRAK